MSILDKRKQFGYVLDYFDSMRKIKDHDERYVPHLFGLRNTEELYDAVNELAKENARDYDKEFDVFKFGDLKRGKGRQYAEEVYDYVEGYLDTESINKIEQWMLPIFVECYPQHQKKIARQNKVVFANLEASLAELSSKSQEEVGEYWKKENAHKDADQATYYEVFRYAQQSQLNNRNISLEEDEDTPDEQIQVVQFALKIIPAYKDRLLPSFRFYCKSEYIGTGKGFSTKGFILPLGEYFYFLAKNGRDNYLLNMVLPRYQEKYEIAGGILIRKHKQEIVVSRLLLRKLDLEYPENFDEKTSRLNEKQLVEYFHKINKKTNSKYIMDLLRNCSNHKGKSSLTLPDF